MNSNQRVEQALEELKCGRFVIVCDDDSRENEGDLIAAAELVNAETVNFAITEAHGLLCQAINEATAHYLGLPMMSRGNSSLHSTAFTVSLDHRDAGTGISAPARALTIAAIARAAGETADQSAAQTEIPDSDRRSEARKSLLQPGHIFPLLAASGGVLQRPGHTEATVDLMRMAGLQPSGILCEIIGADGEMARGTVLDDFAARHQLQKLSIQDIIAYRSQVLNQQWDEDRSQEHRWTAISLEHDTEVELPTRLGHFYSCAIADVHDLAAEHLLIWKGELTQFGGLRGQQAPLLRIQSECFTGEVLFSRRCDCREQLDCALAQIEQEGSGLVIYLRQEGRGIGLRNKMRAYQLQQRQNLDTVEANSTLGFGDDLREYSVAIGVLRRLGLRSVRLLSNNPHKIAALQAAGIAVKRIPIEVAANQHNRDYLETKQQKSGHLLHIR